jgi:hypothetical protein
MATEESDNPDLRTRGYIYWRMLSSNPEVAKNIILGKKPNISGDWNMMDKNVLDVMIDNVGKLASVYYKMPESFVKRIREKLNERVDLDYGIGGGSGGGGGGGGLKNGEEENKGEEYVDSTGVKRSEYVKEN